MKQRKIFRFACLVLLLSAIGACKKVITVNLNSSSPRYIVVGNITDQAPPYLVTITKSINFDQDNVFPTVSGAVVVITDATTNQADTLKETTPGNYNTHLLTGTPGHTYQLYINTSGNTFTAHCTMPAHISLDSLYTQPSPFGGDHPQLVPMYTDPVTMGNYYHFVEIKNDKLTDAIYIRNDRLINGQVIKTSIGGGGLQSGDNVTLTMECIDSAVYQYFYTLAQTKDQNSATPANPLSNISGGALGYFSAHTASVKSIVVP